jgi:RNA polymerase sigma-70 factor, ECF subfamily
MADLSDEELIAGYRARPGSAGGQELLNQLFERYHARVSLWCFRMTGDRESAADLAQEVFIKVYRYLDSYRGDSKFSTWLYSIARNHCFTEVRTLASRREQSFDPMLHDLVDPSPDPHQRVEGQNLSSAMRDLVRSTLTELENRVLALHYGEEMPLDAVSRLLQLENASGAKAYITSARRKLERAAASWKAKQDRTRPSPR